MIAVFDEKGKKMKEKPPRRRIFRKTGEPMRKRSDFNVGFPCQNGYTATYPEGEASLSADFIF